ncbi:MAG TPA: hypothetical protein DCQ64_15925 [Candidatus Rokubacteria bacterium]|nr:hypothetical protein [Candidatus Rokubacteria bacterium]
MPTLTTSGVSTTLEVLTPAFEAAREQVQPHLTDLYDDIPMTDGDGTEKKLYATGGYSKPREMYGNPEHLDRLGSYVLTAKPITYGNGFEIRDDELSDARIKSALVDAGQLGTYVGSYFEELLVTNIIEQASAGTQYDGFDGQMLFSNSHTWTVSDQTPGIPAPTYTSTQDNLLATSGIATVGDVLTDLYAGLAAMDGYVNDKGIRFGRPSNFKLIALGCSLNGPLMQMLDLAFKEVARASDNTNRSGWQWNVSVLGSPHLTNNNNWYLFRIPAGGKKPMGKLNRQDVVTETYRDPKLLLNYWQYSFRCRALWLQWWNAVKFA